MSVAFVNQYRIEPGHVDAFIEAARKTVELSTSLGARVVVRNITIGGEQSNVRIVTSLFANAVSRGGFLDEVLKPENQARNALVQLMRTGAITLVSRAFLNETPPTEDLPPITQVMAVGRWRIAPGCLAEGEGALAEAKSIRQSLGVEARTFTVANAGANSGLRQLNTYVSSHQELAELLAKVTERVEGNGPIPRAVDSGALIPVSQSVSTLVAL